ncbi:hypothetical protein GCM10010203_32750 [Actinomadura yumaensis]
MSSNCTIFDVVVYTVVMVRCTWAAGVRRDYTETLMDLTMFLAANFGLDSFNDHSGPPDKSSWQD